MIKLNYPKIAKAQDLETVLCLATLIATENLSKYATIQDAINFYERLECGCSECGLVDTCLACIINE